MTPRIDLSMNDNRDFPVTVQQLINKLKEFPPEMLVLINGYEGGFYDVDIENIEKILVYRNVNKSYYCGPHDQYNLIYNEPTSSTEHILIR